MDRKVILFPITYWPKNADFDAARTRAALRRVRSTQQRNRKRRAKLAQQLMQTVGERLFS